MSSKDSGLSDYELCGGYPGDELPDKRQESLSWQRRLFNDATLPEICVNVHMAVNGSSDGWPEDAVSEAVAMLQARLGTWQDSVVQQSLGFDDAVKSLVQATIDAAKACKAT